MISKEERVGRQQHNKNNHPRMNTDRLPQRQKRTYQQNNGRIVPDDERNHERYDNNSRQK